MNNIVCGYFASNPYKDFDGDYDKHYEESLFLENAPYSEYRLVILSQMIIQAQSTTSRQVLPKTKLLVREMCWWYKSDSSPHEV